MDPGGLDQGDAQGLPWALYPDVGAGVKNHRWVAKADSRRIERCAKCDLIREFGAFGPRGGPAFRYTASNGHRVTFNAYKGKHPRCLP